MNALERIKDLLIQYNWSVYKLSAKSGLSPSTLANMFARNNMPTIPTLEMICKGFGISMSSFFNYENDNENVFEKQNLFLTKFNSLSEEQQLLIIGVMDNMS